MDYLNLPNNKFINEGDVCVIYVSESQRYILNIKPNAQIQTKFGQVRADDLVGHQYGIRFDCKKGWILPLRLTPEMWTQMLPHRTQILYQADISMILLQLDIKPGSIVVESGTGSGSLSHSLLRACRPNGFLYTFEKNDVRAREAQAEFTEHGLGDYVKVSCKDVCEDGFDHELIGRVDACILDLPQTWSAIEEAYKLLKPFGSRLCTFSPCIEQVKQNVSKMTDLKMKDIVTLETLMRPHEVKVQSLRVWDDDLLDKLSAIDNTRLENLAALPGDNNIDCDETKMVDTKLDQDEKRDEDALQRALTDPKAPFNANMLPKRSYIYPKQFTETISHSGYLTFATKRP